MLVYQKILDGNQYLPSGLQTHIKLIRPISLLNLDFKLLPKIIANRLAHIMSSLIHPSQAGFTQGTSATFKIQKVLAVLEMAIHLMRLL